MIELQYPGQAMLLGFTAGALVRVLLLRVDYRQYPTYPHGYLTHLGLGAIAAAAGAVVLPALVEREFTAVTFLLLVATQFRDIRKIERDTLLNLEQVALVPRGAEYIEGIARVFEARNYMVMFVSVVTSAAAGLWGWWAALLAALATAVLAQVWKSGPRLGRFVDVEVVPVRWEGAKLYVGQVFIMNVAIAETREQISRWAVGVLLKPKNARGERVLSDVGQRMAVISDVTSLLGIRQDVATPEFTTLARKDQASGVVGIYLTPMRRNDRLMVETIRNVPVLESSRGGGTQAAEA